MTAATAHKWISIDDRLPTKSGTLCLVAIDVVQNKKSVEDFFPAIADFHNGAFEVYDNVFVKDAKLIRYWMPFPVDLPPWTPRATK